MRTSFHHQPEAQHPKSPAIETPAGRLPHLSVKSRHPLNVRFRPGNDEYYGSSSSPPVAATRPASRRTTRVAIRLISSA